MLTVRIQEKNHSESIMVLKLKDGDRMDYSEKNTKDSMEEVRRICLDYVQKKAEG